MKKICTMLMVAMAGACLALPSVTAFADTSAEAVVAPQSEIVFESKGNYLPSIFSDEYTYNISVYGIEDAEYAQPIAENVGMFYTFAKPGTYKLKYTLKNVNTSEITYAYSEITLIDTEVPALFLNGAYEDAYEVGTSVTVLDVTIHDNADSDLTEFSYQILFNDEDVTNSVIDGKLTIGEGSYEVVYTAEDNSGNVGSLSVRFSGGNMLMQSSDEEPSGGCFSGIGCASLAGIALMGLAAMTVKNKGGRKDEKDE